MCTAVSVNLKNHYFGRNLDYEHNFGEKIVITPRNFPFGFTNGKTSAEHFAMIGVAFPYDNYPLYFDAVNEKGLAIAGLRFAGFSEYREKIENKINVASFELIPYLLTECENVKETEKLLENINITNQAFDKEIPPSPLHWIIADSKDAITLEQTKDGLKVYDNPIGVLTNNPTFDMQMFNLKNYMTVSAEEPQNEFSDKIELKPYSRGMGAVGLPGDFSSMSRFVKTSFITLNSVFGDKEEDIVNHFFHILYSVFNQKGCVRVGADFEITNYTSCCNADKGIYYYTTYNNSTITAVSMHREDLNSNELIIYDMKKDAEIMFQN